MARTNLLVSGAVLLLSLLTTLPAGPQGYIPGAPWRLVAEDVGTTGKETKVMYAHADTPENYRVDFLLDGSKLCMPRWGERWPTWYVETGGVNLSYGQTYHVKIEVSRASPEGSHPKTEGIAVC